MADVIIAAAAACRQGGYTLQVPMTDILLVTKSLDFSGIHVVGLGNAFNTPKGFPNGSGYIQASAAQFDVITSSGKTIIENLSVDGGWDGHATGLSGDIVSLKPGASGAPPYGNTFINCTFANAKQRGIYIEGGGYTSFFNVHVLACGLHALECRYGTNSSGGTYPCTTIRDYGGSQFGTTPNGYGIVLTDCTSCAFRDSILEETKGIQLNGASNEALTFDGVYQEVTAGGLFITDGNPSIPNNTSHGVGLVVRGCFGGNTSIPSLPNWQQVYFEGNSNLTVPSDNRILQNDGGVQLVSATSDVTAASLTLNPGTYLVFGTVQSIINAGTGNITQLACNVSTSSTASGLANTIGDPSFSAGADQQTYNSTGGISDLRVNCFTWIQLTAATTIYLRTHIALNGTVTMGYRGRLNAVLIQ